MSVLFVQLSPHKVRDSCGFGRFGEGVYGCQGTHCAEQDEGCFSCCGGHDEVEFEEYVIGGQNELFAGLGSLFR